MIHYLSVCNGGLLSRIILADVSGHGLGVSTAAQSLLGLMHRYINIWDQSDFMRDLDRAFRQDQQGSPYATAVLLGFFRKLSQLAFTNAGHYPPLWFHASDKRWGLLTDDPALAATAHSGLPLGLIPGTDYQQSVVNLTPGDLLILYTDAIPEAENQAGEQLGRERLFQLAKGLPTGSPVAAGRSLVSAVREFNEGTTPSDDETMIVLQPVSEAA